MVITEAGDQNIILPRHFQQVRPAGGTDFFSVNFNGKLKVTEDSSVTEHIWRYYFRPIWVHSEEVIKVSSGDGKRNIGGKGLHVFESTIEDRQTLSVDWNIELN